MKSLTCAFICVKKITSNATVSETVVMMNDASSMSSVFCVKTNKTPKVIQNTSRMTMCQKNCVVKKPMLIRNKISANLASCSTLLSSMSSVNSTIMAIIEYIASYIGPNSSAYFKLLQDAIKQPIKLKRLANSLIAVKKRAPRSSLKSPLLAA